MSEYAAESSPGTVVQGFEARRDAKKAFTWADEQYKKARDARVRYERQWQINVAFYFGKQNVVITNTAASNSGYVLRVPDAPPWRVRLVINRVRPIVRTLISKLTANKPIFTVVPMSGEDRDIVAARVAEQIFSSAWSCKNIQKVLRQAVWWTALTGTGYIKCYWDPDAIDKDSDQVGDICYERVDPYHIFVPNMEEEDIENQPFVLHVMTKSKEWVEKAYGKDAAKNTIKSTDDPLTDHFMSVMDVEPVKRDEVCMLEFWIKPGHMVDYPDGAYLLFAGEKLVSNTDTFPYEHGMYPFAKIDDIPTGRFYADSVVTDLVPLQREYNRTRSQVVESKNRMSKPQIIAPKGSVDPRRMTSEPGQVIEYIPGFTPPQPLPLQNLPPYVENIIDRLQADMDDISGQHEISRGNTPPQVTAATAISFLQEQDDSKLAYTVASIEDCIVKIGRLTLGYVRQFWDTPRLVRVVGADGAFESAYYKAKNLGQTYDVRVEAGSVLQMSKAAKQALLMDMMKNNLLPPDMGMEMLGIAGIDRIYESIMADRRQAERENLKMSVGAQLFAHDYDNHALHIEIHNRYRKTQDFEMLPEQIQMIFDVHVAQHKMFVQNALAEQQMQGFPVPGQPQLPSDAGPPQDQLGEGPNAPAPDQPSEGGQQNG